MSFAIQGTTDLGAEPLGESLGGQALDVLLALLDDDEREDGNVVADDATADRLALALTGTAGAVARVAVREQQAHTVGEEDTLLHGETLLVVAAGDAEDVALPLVTDAAGRKVCARSAGRPRAVAGWPAEPAGVDARVGRDLLRHALVVEDAEAALLI